MRVAVTGASGFIGRRIVERLHAAGHAVYAYGRRPAEQLSQPLPVPYQTWDILRGPLRPSPGVDAVVHCAARVSDWGTYDQFYAVNVVGTRNVIETFPVTAQFIHMSSASVYDPFSTNVSLTEDDVVLSLLRSPYARTKLLAEQVVAESGRPATILRPHGVYGPGDTTLLPRLVQARRFGRMLAIGDGRNRVTLTYVENLAYAAECALDRPFRYEAFNIVDPVADTIDEMLRGLIRALGYDDRILYIPVAAARPLASMMEGIYRLRGSDRPPLITHFAIRQMAGNGVLDGDKAARMLDYHPTLTYRDAFADLAGNPNPWLSR